jgi:hypothetical protein
MGIVFAVILREAKDMHFVAIAGAAKDLDVCW